MTKYRYTLIVVFVIMFGSSQAGAKDLTGLADFVRPAYLAMNFAMMCAQHDPWFLIDTSGPRGTPLHYAEHVKNEAIDNLSQPEAMAILKQAADAARTFARTKLYELARPGESDTITAIKDWCGSDGKRLILRFIRQHDNEHLVVEQFLDHAKR